LAIITGTPSAVGLEVDATSKAARVTLYDSAGNEVNSPPVGSYILPVNIRQTAATAANATVWAMRNGATRTVFIREINLSLGFDGTAAATTTCRYGFQRFTAATPTAGTALTAIKRRAAYDVSTIADARFVDTGLTTTSVVFETDFAVIGLPISVTSVNRSVCITFEGAGERYDSFELAPNAGLAIRLNVAAVIGLSLNGFISWDER